MANDTDVQVRLAVLESSYTHHEEESRNIHTSMLKTLESVGVKVDDIKERIDKQNGTLPHMAESITAIEKHLSKQDDLVAKDQTTLAKVKLKTNIVWGIVAAIGVALSEIIAHHLLKN